VADRIQVVSQSGNVTDVNGGQGVDEIDFVVAKAPGAGSIDLNQTSVEIIGTNGQVSFELDDLGGSVDIFTEPGESDVVLTDSADRAEVNVVLNGTPVDYGDISAGDRASVTFTTASGATTTTEIRVPTTLTSDQTSVRL
jgi:flagellin FlaB